MLIMSFLACENVVVNFPICHMSHLAPGELVNSPIESRITRGGELINLVQYILRKESACGLFFCLS